jgi:NitT/TauT family transport system ATP-binding protein
MNSVPQLLRILIHAPTQGAVARARNNAANLKKDAPDAEVAIIVNAEGVTAVLDAPRTDTDSLTLVCGNTLQKLGRSAPDAMQTVDAAISAIARMQGDGWLYVRA